MTWFNRITTLPSAVTVTTAPAVYPIRLDALRAHLRITGTEEDDVLISLIREATAALELATSRRFINTVLAERYDSWPLSATHPVGLSFAPVVSIGSITYIDDDGNEQTWATTEYGIDTSSEPGRLYLVDGKLLPNLKEEEPHAVTVNYTAGYGTSPDDCPPLAQAAIKMRAAAAYCNREGYADADAWDRAVSLLRYRQ